MPEALPPGSIVGILGGGQLGRMLALAAARLGLKSHVYSDEPNVPAFDVAASSTLGSFDDEADLLAQLHHEFIPSHGLCMVGKHHEIYLSDFRKVAPEKQRTILRQPVARG